jgi:hypothetical protein
LQILPQVQALRLRWRSYLYEYTGNQKTMMREATENAQHQRNLDLQPSIWFSGRQFIENSLYFCFCMSIYTLRLYDVNKAWICSWLNLGNNKSDKFFESKFYRMLLHPKPLRNTMLCTSSSAWERRSNANSACIY